MFKRYPYWGWLLLSAFLWCMAGWRHYSSNKALEPGYMAEAVSKDLQKREAALQNFLKDEQLIKRAVAQTLSSKEVEKIQELPFYVYAYDRDTLVFWNNNKTLPAWSDVDSVPKLLSYGRGNYVGQYFKFPYLDNNVRLEVLFPVIALYPFENGYLKSHFEANNHIPVNTQFYTHPVKGAYAIENAAGKAVFYLQFPPTDIQHKVPDTILVLLMIAALVMLISWVQLITIRLSDNGRSGRGLLVLLIIICATRGLNYAFGFPFGLDNLPFFSPQLYASSSFLHSLGDVVLNTLCFLWISVFVVRHTPYRFFADRIQRPYLKYLLGILLIVLAISYTLGFVNIIRSLILDSSISFELGHFDSIDGFTLIGLFTICVITGTSCIVIYFINTQLGILFGSKWIKNLIFLAIATVFVVWLRKDIQFYGILISWLWIMSFLLDQRRLTFVADLFATHMLGWAVFICAFCTGLLYYYNHIKERDARRVFADRIVQQRDVVTEYAFQSIAQNIEKDRYIRTFFSHPSPEGRKEIDLQLDALYFGGQLGKYQAKVYMYDTNMRPLYNIDTTGYRVFINEVNKANPAQGPLYYKEYAQDNHYYLAYIPVTIDSFGHTGHMFIDLALKQSTPGTVYPELLQPAALISSQGKGDYSYAIYIKDGLIGQYNDYAFPVSIQSSAMAPTQYVFYDRGTASELWYKYSDTKFVIVVHKHQILIEAVTLFSYVFGMEMLVAICILLYQLYISYLIKQGTGVKLVNLTLRRRIHLSMLAIVLVSFVIIGFVTVYFYESQYKASRKDKLQGVMGIVEQSVQEYLRQNNGSSTENLFDITARAPKFKYFVTSLANSQKIDINIFNTSGALEVTSQDDIYDRELLARIIRPDAYQQMLIQGKSLLIQDEKIGDLSYVSSYVPLRNEAGNTIGYINIPFFSSEKDLEYQISNIIVTLVNLYAFIFLISSLFTIVITRWITNIFNVIIEQFSRLNLKKNERIRWPYEDEIGTLVNEYNNMVRKVEENAAVLARSERESAWREMARQVAHEIKNPLTPMKLNIQYLQQALANNQPNAMQLAGKVSASLIEQIDNLSYIASEFSNFAKMPEAMPEDIDLNKLMRNATELYMNKERVQTQLQIPDEQLTVHADRSQLLRVFTNLLENATQAIPAEREGKLEVILKKENEHVLLSFSDNGEGISEETAAHIFQPYFTTKTSGTGLGLAMTRKIIEFWQGQIWFETEEGVGTTFYIRLPLKKD